MNNSRIRCSVLIGMAFVLTTMFSAMAQNPSFSSSHAVVAAGLSASEYHSKALELINQADNTYDPDFFDQIGWQEAVGYAEAAVNAEPSNPEYLRTLGQAYTQSQFWIQGYRAFKQLQDLNALDAQAKSWAALCATKVGYIRLTHNAPEEALGYLQDAQFWQDSPTVQALLQRAQTPSAVASR